MTVPPGKELDFDRKVAMINALLLVGAKREANRLLRQMSPEESGRLKVDICGVGWRPVLEENRRGKGA